MGAGASAIDESSPLVWQSSPADIAKGEHDPSQTVASSEPSSGGSVLEASLRKAAVSKNEFASWIRQLGKDDIGRSFASGEEMLERVKAELTSSRRISKAASASGLSGVESLATLLYTSEACLTSNINTILRSAAGDSESDRDELLRRLTDYAYFTSPLLTAFRKLPLHQGGVAFRLFVKQQQITGDAKVSKRSSGMWHRAVKAISDALGHPELEEYGITLPDLAPFPKGGACSSALITFSGFTSCASRFLTLRQADLLSTYRTEKNLAGRLGIVCMRCSSGRRVGNLSFSPRSNEVVLLPGWTGRIVGRVDHSWRKVLSDMWGIDLEGIDVIEVEETTGFESDSVFNIDQKGDSNRQPGDVETEKKTGSHRSARSSSTAREQSAASTPLLEAAPLIEKKFADALAMAMLREYVDVTSSEPENVAALRHLAFLYAHAKNVADECKTLRRLLRLVPEDYDSNIRLAFLLDREVHDYAAAIRQYEIVLGFHDGTSDVHCTVGQLLEQHGGPDVMFRAKRHYELGIRLDPKHPDSHAHLGYVLERRRDLGDDELARRHYEACLVEDPTHPKASHLLARMLILTCGGDTTVFRRAQSMLASSVERDGNVADAHYWFGVMLQEERRHHFLHPNHHHHDKGRQFDEGDTAALVKIRKEFQAAVDLDPQHQAALSRLGNVLVAMPFREYETARPHLKAALKMDYKDADAHAALAVVLEKEAEKSELRDFDDARSHYEESLDLEPNHPEVLCRLGRLMEKRFDDAKTAKIMYRKALDIAPDFPEALTCIGWLSERFSAKKTNGDGRRVARRMYDLALKGNPHHPHALARLGAFVSNVEGDATEGRHLLERSIFLDDQDAEAHHDLGRIFDKKERNYEAAMASYHTSLAIDNFDADCHNELGFLYLAHRRDVSKAKNHFQRALSLRPDHADAHNNLGTVLKKFGDGSRDTLEDAKSEFESAVQADPSHSDAQSNLAAIVAELNATESTGRGKDVAAREHFESALRLRPNDFMTRVAYAQLLEQGFREFMAARLQYLEALRAHPYYGPAHSYLGRLILNDPDTALLGPAGYEEGMQYLQNAVQLMPRDAESRNLLGALLEHKLHRPQDARVHYEQAVLINPNMAEAHYNLGQYFANSLLPVEEETVVIQHVIDGNEDEGGTDAVEGSAKSLARRHLLAAIKLNPTCPPYHLAMARLLMTSHFNELSEAVDHIEKVLDAFPDHAEALFMLGSVEERSRRRYERACSLYRRALASPSASKALLIEVNFTLAQLMKKHLDNLKGAVYHFEAVLAIDPANEQALSNLERLRKSGLRPDCMENSEYAEFLLTTFSSNTSSAPADADGVGAKGRSPAAPSGATPAVPHLTQPSSKSLPAVDGMYPRWY